MRAHHTECLESRKLIFKRRGLCVLDGIDVRVEPTQLLGILGPNGAGKSSLLQALAGEAGRQVSSQVWLNGQSLGDLSVAEQAQWRAVLPQESNLGFDLQVQQLIAMGAYVDVQMPQALVRELSRDAAIQADITHLLDRSYTQLSGGERQRVQFARVLLQVLIARTRTQGARYLLLDEPTSSLDPKHQHRLLKTIKKLACRYNVGVVLVLHDINLAAAWCDTLLLLHQRQVLAQGTPAAVLTAANLRKLYDLEAHILPHPSRPGRPLVVFA